MQQQQCNVPSTELINTLNKYTPKLYDICGQKKQTKHASTISALRTVISISFSSAGQLNKNKNFAKKIYGVEVSYYTFACFNFNSNFNTLLLYP